MRTTLDLSDNLVNEAMKATKIKTKTRLIEYALENIVRREKVLKLKNYMGKLKLNIDLNVLRSR